MTLSGGKYLAPEGDLHTEWKSAICKPHIDAVNAKNAQLHLYVFVLLLIVDGTPACSREFYKVALLGFAAAFGGGEGGGMGFYLFPVSLFFLLYLFLVFLSYGERFRCGEQFG